MHLYIKRTAQLLMLGGFVALSACQFGALSENIQRTEEVGSVSGRIVEEKPTKSTVIVVAFYGQIGREFVLNAEQIEARDYSFGVLPGHYYLAAFEDRNGDGDYQVGEPGGIHGTPDGPVRISVNQGMNLTGLDIHLRNDFEKPDLADDSIELSLLWNGRKNIGAVTALQDNRFDPEIAQGSLWQPFDFSIDPGPGLFFLEDYDPDKIPVVFIHGMSGSPGDWETVIQNLDRDRFQPWMLYYASGHEINRAAGYLDIAIEQLRITHGFDEIFIVAHSMGGLVAKEYIDRFDNGTKVRQLITLATPWDGHEAAQRGVDNAPVVAPVWVDMAPGSDFLQSIHETTLPNDMPFHLLFSFRNSSRISRTSSDGTITLASQLEPSMQEKSTRKHGFDSTHVGILSDDPVINRINSLLADADILNNPRNY